MPIFIRGSGGALDENVFKWESFATGDVGFVRDGNTITLTFPLVLDGACVVKRLAIRQMWIGESETGSANRYRWRFSGVFQETSGEWCMVNDSTGAGVHADDMSVNFTYDGSNLILTITDEDALAVMDEDATYFNRFHADLFYTEV